MNTGVLALVSGLGAQALKVVLAGIFERRWAPSLFLANGGMPSSHTATVTTLALSIGYQEGVSAPVFSLVMIFSLFVIFEATGLRQEMGHQAKLLNELMDMARHGERIQPRRLRELIGHTWSEVAGGMVFGTLVFWFFGRSG